MSEAEGVAGATPQETHKIKRLKPRQRACDVLNAKGKHCFGNLKRWYDYPGDVEALVGAKKEVYRCEFCRTIYTPDLSDAPNSFTVRY